MSCDVLLPVVNTASGVDRVVVVWGTAINSTDLQIAALLTPTHLHPFPRAGLLPLNANSYRIYRVCTLQCVHIFCSPAAPLLLTTPPPLPAAAAPLTTDPFDV